MGKFDGPKNDPNVCKNGSNGKQNKSKIIIIYKKIPMKVRITK